METICCVAIVVMGEELSGHVRRKIETTSAARDSDRSVIDKKWFVRSKGIESRLPAIWTEYQSIQRIKRDYTTRTIQPKSTLQKASL